MTNNTSNIINAQSHSLTKSSDFGQKIRDLGKLKHWEYRRVRNVEAQNFDISAQSLDCVINYHLLKPVV